jgi:hypothetical protein
MNIFYLDKNPAVAAKYHCDKHVVKMILETAQLLSTTVYMTDRDCGFHIYKPTHRNHPSAVWVRSSMQHYKWLSMLGIFLCLEYTKRYKKVHKTQAIMENLFMYTPDIIDRGWNDPPQAMPDEFKQENTVEAYREYYRVVKKDILAYNYTKIPNFLLE